MSNDDSGTAEALTKLAAEDVEAARDAEAAIAWLTAGEGLGVLTQERVQTFLWYGLPMKWLTDTDHHRRVTDALGRAFDLLGLSRYAAICRSSTTAKVLDAYNRSEAEGKKAFNKADIASGVRPPDIAELVWGPVMGMEESAALSAAAEFLELAIVSGGLVPGARGWKQRQADLVRTCLSTPRVESGGRALLDVIRAERLETWLSGRRSPSRRRLLEPLVDAVHAPAQLPSSAQDPLPPLRWLLEELVDGQPLTQTGNLNRAFVQHAAARFGWWPPNLHSLPRGEDELHDLHHVRGLTQRLGLIRSSGRKLALTPRGRGLIDDPEGLWRTAALGLLPADGFTLVVGEVTLALLATRDTVPAGELQAVAAEVVGEEGWRDKSTDAPADDRAITWSTHVTTNLLRALGLLAVGDDWNDDSYGLTDVGRATALEALHRRATGPRSSPWG
ncbi:MAG: hypothetical protein GEU81_16245 [Nitriliruptorales bacterium]|nr:hypothetical protein [Nitriliruptorales bacterium]